jgi:aminoglycoside/choline kinase family phosphotransferase
VRVPHIVAKDLEQGLLLLKILVMLYFQLTNDETVDQYYAQSFNS